MKVCSIEGGIYLKETFSIILLISTGLLGACRAQEVQNQPTVEIPIQEIDIVTSEQLQESNQDNPIRQQLSYLPNDKFLDSIHYLTTPDSLTKEITEFIFYLTFNGPLPEDFEKIEDADNQILLSNAILSTAYLNSQSLTNQEQIDYIISNGLDYHILREHVEKTSQFLYGSSIILPLNATDSSFPWIDSLDAYEVIPRGINIYNPVVLSIEENESYYEVVTVIPRKVEYDDVAYFGDLNSSDVSSYNSLETVIPHCQKRKFILTKGEHGTFTLSAYYLLDYESNK